MSTWALHAVVAAVLAGAIFAFFAWLDGETRTSLPLAPLLIGLQAGLLAHHLSPWATPGLLLAYALACWVEWRRTRRARAAAAAARPPAPVAGPADGPSDPESP